MHPALRTQTVCRGRTDSLRTKPRVGRGRGSNTEVPVKMRPMRNGGFSGYSRQGGMWDVGCGMPEAFPTRQPKIVLVNTSCNPKSSFIEKRSKETEHAAIQEDLRIILPASLLVRRHRASGELWLRHSMDSILLPIVHLAKASCVINGFW